MPDLDQPSIAVPEAELPAGEARRIRELDEIKSQFSANVGHELRKPLALILGPAQRLVDDDGTMDPAERLECAQVVARNARMLLQRVNDLIDVSRLEAGKLKVEPSSHRIGETAAAANLDGTVVESLLEELVLRPRSSAIEPAREDDRALVLVVEDNTDMRRFIAQCLEPTCDVVQACDGRDGLEKAMRLRPTLVITDITMPNVSGDEMIAQMRSIPELRSTPVLILSAKADEELMIKLLNEGAQDFIVKPFVEKDLTVRVRNIVVSAQARAERAQALERERAARQEAELLKQRLHSLFMQAPISIAVLRGHRHVVELANPAICRLWGREEHEVLDRPIVEAVPGLRHHMHVKLLDEVYRTGVPYIGNESPVVHGRGGHDTETLYFNFVNAPFRNIEGEIEGIFLIATNVTDQVTARDQVNSLRLAAESANRAKDEFLAMLGHELRNPLSPIVTALQLMKLQGGEDSEHARTIIERQVTHLTRLVDDLLDVSRIAQGKVDLKRELVEMAEVTTKAIEMASPLLEHHAHKLTVKVPGEGLLVEGDSTRLAQVVSNLLTNAAKYTPRSGTIAIQCHRDAKDVVLCVRDNGIGMSKAVLPHVFRLFVQERQGIDRSLGGLGLGLTIVRNLVERHGGFVSASSDGPGRGSEFTIRLPSATRPALAIAPPAGAPRAAGEFNDAETHSPERILIVDDNADAADMLAVMLKQKGYDARVAFDGPSALKLAREYHPTVAVLDIGLPVMDGYALASRLRAIPELEQVRLIALTGYGQLSDREKAVEAGFQQHLVKPVSLKTIEAAVNDSSGFGRTA